jgi:hypothetical protein
MGVSEEVSLVMVKEESVVPQSINIYLSLYLNSLFPVHSLLDLDKAVQHLIPSRAISG